MPTKTVSNFLTSTSDRQSRYGLPTFPSFIKKQCTKQQKILLLMFVYHISLRIDNLSQYIHPMAQRPLAQIQLTAAIQNILNILAEYQRNSNNYESFYSPQQLEKLMDIILICFENEDYYFLELLQKMTSCFNTAFREAHNKFSFDFTLKTYFTFITNWKIGYNIKKFLRVSFFKIIEYWSQELDQFFQKLALEISKSLDIIYQHSNGNTFVLQSDPIFNQTTNKIYHYTINMPSDEVKVYENLVFILEGLFHYHKEDQNAPDEKSIEVFMYVLKKVLYHIFVGENVMRFKDSVFITLQILQEIINLQNDTLKDIFYAELQKWQELFPLFQGIYRFQTVQDEFTPLGYNYLIWEQHSYDLAKIKCQTAEVHSFFSSQSNVQLPVIFQNQLVQIVNSDLLGSLKYFASYRGEIPEELKNMAQQYIGLYVNYFQIITASLEEMKDILFSMLLPILSRQIQERQGLFEEATDDLMCQIEDCLEDNQSHNVLSHCCYILDILLSDNDNFVGFLAKYITASLINNREDLFNMSGSYEALDKKTCFFILHVTNLTHRNCNSIINLFQYLLTPEYFHQMNPYEKAYLYGYLSAEWSLIYQNNKKAGEFYFQYVFDPNIGQPLRKFIMNFIFNITVEYYSENFFFNFLKNFQNFSPQDQAINIVSRTIQFHNKKFTETFAVEIIRAIVGSIDKSILLSSQKNQLLNKENRYVSSIFYELGCISKIKALCYENSELFKELVKFVTDFFQIAKSFMLEDSLGDMLCNLLELCQELPYQLMPVIKQYIVIYQRSEYQGQVILKIMNRLFRLSANNDQTLCLLFGALIEAISYFSFFPDHLDIISQFKIQINNHLIILQHALLVYGNRLPSASIEDMLNIARSLVTNLEAHHAMFKLPQTLLQARISNFKTILEIYHNDPFSLEDLLVKAKNHIFSTYDADLLIFILDRIKHTFESQQDRFNLLNIMANLLKTIKEHANNKAKYLKLLNEKKKLNLILSNIIIPVHLHQSVEKGVYQFIAGFIKIDPQFAELILHLEESDREVINGVFTKFTNAIGKQLPQTSKDRQMFKIVSKRKECDSTMLDEFHTNKKNSHKRTTQNLSDDSDNEGYTQNQKKKNKDLSKAQRITEKFMRKSQNK